MHSFLRTFKKYKALIPCLVLAVISVRTLLTLTTGSIEISGELYEYSISINHYFAFAAVALSLIAFIVYRPIYKFLLIITLTLGLFNILNFTVDKIEQSSGFNWLSLTYQPTSLYIVLLTAMLYARELKQKLTYATVQRPKQVEFQEKQEFKKDFEKFLVGYSNKSSAELIKIVNDNRFTPAALQAARQILEDREKV